MTTKQFSKYYIGFCLSLMLFSTGALKAQNFEINPQSTVVSIHGTSSVHDWDMKVTKVSSELVVSASKQISALSVKIPVTSIKSGKQIMDGKTYDAFDAKKNPNIVFQLTEASSVKWSDKESEITITGNLSMAGETRKISFKTLAKITKTGDYELKGTVALKMSDYGMTPPTAFFGTMKTGDTVSVIFDVTFKG